MITTSSAFNTANAESAKRFIYIAEISSYGRAFTNDSGDAGVLARTTLGSDNFNRADSPTLGADWVTPVGAGIYHALQVSGDQAKSFSSFGAAGSWAHNIPSDQWVECEWTGSAGQFTLWLRYSEPGGGSDVAAWECGFGAGSTAAYILDNNGTAPSHDFLLATPLTAGDVIRVELQGVNFSVYQNGVLVATWAAPTAAPTGGTSSGRAAVECDGPSASCDNFSVGGWAVSGWAGDLALAGFTVCPWLVSIDDLNSQANDLDGGASQDDLVFNVLDLNAAITADMASFVFEGKAITLKQGFPGMALADFTVLFTGKVWKVDSDNANLEYRFSCSLQDDLSAPIWKQGDDGHPTSSAHLKTLSGHPCDLIKGALITELGLSPALVDTAKLDAYKNGPFAGMHVIFSLDQAPKADEFIKAQLLKPLGGYMWINSQKKVSFNFFQALATVTPFTVTEDLAFEIEEQQPADIVNTLVLQYDKGQSSGSYGSEKVLTLTASRSKYGRQAEQNVQADGVRSALGGTMAAYQLAWGLFTRYGFATRIVELSTLWQGCVLELGDEVALTTRMIPDLVAGTRGVTAKRFEVLGRMLMFEEGVVRLTLLEASSARAVEWPPDGETTYALAGSTDQGKYMFMANNSDQYSTGAAGNELA